MALAQIVVIPLVIADKSVITPLGADDQYFRSVLFYGGKGTPETANTSTAYVQLATLESDGDLGDFASAIPVPSAGWSNGIGAEITGTKVFRADQFKIKVGTDGDGIVAICII